MPNSEQIDTSPNASLMPGRHELELLGVSQVYHVAGKGPVCVVHSGGPGIDWNYLRVPALEASMTVVYIEPIGTGGSGRLGSHPFGYTVERFSKQLGAFLDALDLHDIALVGHSHGGFVALQYAVDRPERIAALVLYDTAAFTGPDFMAAASREVEAFVGLNQGDPIAEDVLLAWQSLGTMRTNADFVALLRRLLPIYFADYRRLGHRFEAVRDALNATLLIGDSQPFDVRKGLPAITCPTLILVGRHDFILGPRHSELLSDLIPRSRLIRFQDSGHFAHIEEPEAFVDALKDLRAMVSRP